MAPLASMTWNDGSCSLAVREAAPGVFVIALDGSLNSPGLIGSMLDWVLERAGGHRLHLFWDTTAVVSYKTEAREQVQEWQKRHLGDIAESRVLVTSKVVVMGIAIVNMVVGGLNKAMSERARFEALLARAVIAAERGDDAGRDA